MDNTQMFAPLLLAIEQDESLTPPSVDDFRFMDQRYIKAQNLQLWCYLGPGRYEDNRQPIEICIDADGQCWAQTEGGPMMPWRKITNGLAFERCYDLGAA